MKRTTTTVLATFAIAAFALSGCTLKSDTSSSGGTTSGSSSSKPDDTQANADLTLEGKRIGVAVVGTDHDWDRMAYEGVQETIKELGGEPIAVSGERDGAKMISNLENLITQKPDAIVSILGDAAALDPVFAKIDAAGIPLFTIDQPSEYSVNNVTSDNFFIGSTVARTLAEDMGGKGKIVVFNGFKSVGVCQIRYAMLLEVLKIYPNVEILQPELQDVPANTVEDAKRKMTDVLNKYPEDEGIKAVWACWDVPMTGAAQAIDEAGRDEINVYGIDGDPTAIDMIADPESSYAATMAQQPYEIGKQSGRNIAMHLAKQEVPGTTYFEPLLTTKSNWAEVKETLGL